jgi:Na+-translocating ferredoxin:NAD+ oxidoreductase RnfG subunit
MPSISSICRWASRTSQSVAFALLAAGAAIPAPLPPERVYLTVDEALKLALPGCVLEKATVYLTDAQKKRAGELAGETVDLAIARPYVAKKDGKLVATAYVDVHKVRTLKETVLVVVDAEQRVTRIELLAFGEPEEYAPRAEWYAQFQGRKLDDELHLKRSIRGIAGASLTARATTNAVRRVLAVHKVLGETPEPKR